MAILDFSAFEKAIGQLEESLAYCNSDIVKKDKGLALQLRSAAIQAFEYTYELSWKMLKRYLEMSEPGSAEFDVITFPDLIRSGSEKGLLLNDLYTWKQYRHARSITSHTYNDKKAAEVYALIPGFLTEAKFLLAQLQQAIKKL